MLYYFFLYYGLSGFVSFVLTLFMGRHFCFWHTTRIVAQIILAPNLFSVGYAWHREGGQAHREDGQAHMEDDQAHRQDGQLCRQGGQARLQLRDFLWGCRRASTPRLA